MTSELKATVIYFKDKCTVYFLDMESSNDLPQEQFGIKHLLILELFIPNTFNTTVSSDQLTFFTDLTPEMLNILCFQQISVSCLSVAKVDLEPKMAHAFKKFAASGIAPIFGVPGIFSNPQSDGVICIFRWTVFALVLFVAVVKQSMDEAPRPLRYATNRHCLIFKRS